MNWRDSYTYTSSVKEVSTEQHYNSEKRRLKEKRNRGLKAKGGGGGGAKPDQPDTIVPINGTANTTAKSGLDEAIYDRYATSYGIANLRKNYNYKGVPYEYKNFMD